MFLANLLEQARIQQSGRQSQGEQNVQHDKAGLLTLKKTRWPYIQNETCLGWEKTVLCLSIQYLGLQSRLHSRCSELGFEPWLRSLLVQCSFCATRPYFCSSKRNQQEWQHLDNMEEAVAFSEKGKDAQGAGMLWKRGWRENCYTWELG